MELSQMNHRAVLDGSSPQDRVQGLTTIAFVPWPCGHPPATAPGAASLQNSQGVPRNLPQGCHPAFNTGFSSVLGSAAPDSERGGETPARGAAALPGSWPLQPPVPSPFRSGIPTADVAWPKPARQARWSSCRLGCKSSSFLLCSQGLLICFNTL